MGPDDSALWDSLVGGIFAEDILTSLEMLLHLPCFVREVQMKFIELKLTLNGQRLPSTNLGTFSTGVIFFYGKIN